MGPDSTVLLVLLFLAATAALVGVARLTHLWTKLVSGLLAALFAAVGGMAVVNDYYGYYDSWSQLAADFSGSYASFTTTPVVDRHVTGVASGRLVQLSMPGKVSGIDRSGLVWLPPQYDQPRYASTRFPVLELLHGTPGAPSDFIVHLGLIGLLDHLMTTHAIGPMVIVMPTMSPRTDYQECVDVPGALDDTYITTDVRTDVLAHFRVTADPAEWGIAGYSSGGYCAANLALRHPADFGASGVLDGYFRPTDGPAAAALHDNPAAEAANNPLLAAGRLGRDAAPLPSFWLSAGSGDAADLAAAKAFVRALHGVEQVALNEQPGAAHNFYAWRASLPRVLAWMWTQLAPPDLRVLNPIAGPPQEQQLNGYGYGRNRRAELTHSQRHDPALPSSAGAPSTSGSPSRSSSPSKSPSRLPSTSQSPSPSRSRSQSPSPAASPTR